MARSFWWPGTLSAQVLLVQNFSAKIGGYVSTLAWTPAQQSAATALCSSIVSAIEVTNQCRTAMLAATNWREIVLYGQPKGSPGGQPPVFPVIVGGDYDRGLVHSFFEIRDQIVANNAYTLAMGEDLGIVGAESASRGPAETTPELKTVSTSANHVTINGSMKGMPVMRVEYAPKSQTYSSVAIVTNLPATFAVPKANPDTPELGTIRTIFVKKNADFGNYSPNYDVTLA